MTVMGPKRTWHVDKTPSRSQTGYPAESSWEWSSPPWNYHYCTIRPCHSYLAHACLLPCLTWIMAGESVTGVLTPYTELVYSTAGS